MSPIKRFLDNLFERHRECREGHVASYIPELAKVDPEQFGICVATIDGHVYEVGDSRQPFTIQSISKAFVYGLALDDQGPAGMARKVGVEPSGDAFNAISLDEKNGRPLNPMINAGAIATTGQVVGAAPEERFNRILAMLGRHAGRSLDIDPAVYQSEARTGHRNRAIGHLLRNSDVLTEDPMATVDLYFQQCSVLVDCRDLAIMAATLANQGINPVTGEQAIQSEHVESVLSVMASCGMYDSSGGWIYDVGMPAKSGVGGGVLAVLPGQFGIGVFSPRLDENGNSVRAVRVCAELSRSWGLHQFNPPYCPHTSLRHTYSCRQRQSTRSRCDEDTFVIREHGEEIRVVELQGVLSLATTEPIIREILATRNGLKFLMIDLQHATGINTPAANILADFTAELRLDGLHVFLTNTRALPTLRALLEARLDQSTASEILRFESLDLAMESCEEELLRSIHPNDLESRRRFEESEVAKGMASEEIGVLTSLLRNRSYQSGEIVVREGEAANRLFVITRGVVAVHLGQGADGPRVASFSAGTMVGGMAFVDGGQRSATLIAEGDLECVTLERTDFEGLKQDYPGIYARVLTNIAVSLAAKLRLANDHINLLSTRKSVVTKDLEDDLKEQESIGSTAQD